MLIGALETGGTKMVCALGKEDGTILERVSIPTETPEETIPQLLDYFRGKNVDAIGIASFGPIDLNENSPTYGYILKTPKLKWADTDFVGPFQREFGVPVGWDTDVNGAAIGELTWGAAQGCENVVYVTIGTGIGFGICVNGKPLHGMLHAEAGHMCLPRHPKDTYKGHCPFHNDCFEGFANGSAMHERWGQSSRYLRDVPEVWEMESWYIAKALYNAVLCYSPQKIILGGGVMHETFLFPMIREKVTEDLSGYIQSPLLLDMDNYIVPPALGDNAGVCGATQLGILALEKSKCCG